MTGQALTVVAAFGMIVATCFAWACCIVAADTDADARSQEHEAQADRRAERHRIGGAVDFHAPNSTISEV